jgi:phage terminase small subunit
MDTPTTPTERTPIDRAKFDVHPDVDKRFTLRVLHPRKRRLVDAYVRTGSYTAAARASGYTAGTVSKYINDDPLIQKAIGEVVDQAAILSGVTLERVLQEYARLAFSDIGEFADVIRAAGDSETALELLAEMPADQTASVKAIEYERKAEDGDDGAYITGKLKLTFHDKRGALTDLGRILSVFNDKLTIEDKSAFGTRLSEAIDKLKGLAGSNE